MSAHCMKCGDQLDPGDDYACSVCLKDSIVRVADEAAHERKRTKKAETIAVSEPLFGDNSEDVLVAYYADEIGRGGSDDN